MAQESGQRPYAAELLQDPLLRSQSEKKLLELTEEVARLKAKASESSATRQRPTMALPANTTLGAAAACELRRVRLRRSRTM